MTSPQTPPAAAVTPPEIRVVKRGDKPPLAHRTTGGVDEPDSERPRLTRFGSTATAQPRGVPGTGEGFRPEIQGLRSVAVLMVVFYHVFLDRVSGGVDVFLMVSALLLTRSFARQI